MALLVAVLETRPVRPGAAFGAASDVRGRFSLAG